MKAADKGKDSLPKALARLYFAQTEKSTDQTSSGKLLPRSPPFTLYQLDFACSLLVYEPRARYHSSRGGDR